MRSARCSLLRLAPLAVVRKVDAAELEMMALAYLRRGELLRSAEVREVALNSERGGIWLEVTRLDGSRRIEYMPTANADQAQLIS